VLPVPTYSKNFIRTYANAIGIDSGPVLQRYENYLKNLHAPAADEKTEQTCQTKPPAGPNQYKTVLWILLIIIVFAGAAFFISNRDNKVQDSVQKTTVQNQKEGITPRQPNQNSPLPCPLKSICSNRKIL
jgi:cytoskeletal protein RodZ